jgi:hypothetical protein
MNTFAQLSFAVLLFQLTLVFLCIELLYDLGI